MPVLKPRAKIDRVRNKETQEFKGKYTKWTIIAFSGDLKHWMSSQKNEPKF